MRTPLSDGQVLDAWAARCARFDRELGWDVLRGSGLMLVAALPWLIGGMDSAGYAIFLVALGFAVAWGIWLSNAAILMCPRCSEPPGPRWYTRHARIARACYHCGCRLR